MPWLARNPKGPWFAFVHYWDAHSPYLPPEAYRHRHYDGDPNDGAEDGLERWRAEPSYPFAYRWQVRHYEPFRDLDFVRGLYDAEITYLDDQLQPVLSLLSGEDDDDFAVIFTADHGEVMDNRPGFFDHAGLYDDTIRVPLIFAGSRVPKGWVINGMYQHLDIAPTILSLFGQAVPASMNGTDLMRVATSAPTAPGTKPFTCPKGRGKSNGVSAPGIGNSIKVIDPGVHLKKEDELFDLSS